MMKSALRLLFVFAFTSAFLHGDPAPPSPDEDTLLLTWQRDPTTTMTLQWLEPGYHPPLGARQEEKARIPVGVPRVADPSLNTWPEDGVLEVDSFTDLEHLRHDPEVFSARMRMGWNEEGFFVWLMVQDPAPFESANDRRLRDGDSVISFLSTGAGSPERLQMLFAPGRDPEQEAPRLSIRDHRSGNDLEEITVDFAVTPTDGGYLAAFRYPWDIFGLDARTGTTFAFHTHLYAFDGRQGEKRFLGWSPNSQIHADPSRMMPLELVEEAQGPRRLEAAHLESRTGQTIIVFGHPDQVGQTVTFQAGDMELGEVVLEAREYSAYARFEVPQQVKDGRIGSVAVIVDGDVLEYVTPDLEFLKKFRTAAHSLEYWVDGEEDRTRVAAERHEMTAWRATTRHRVTRENLTPDTTYRFRINESDRIFAFRTMPETLSRPLVVAVGGDTRHRKEWMLRTNRQAMAYNPDFIVWGGDLAYADARESRLYRWDEWFEANAEGLVGEDGRLVPLVVAIGNHEVFRGYAANSPDFDNTDDWRMRNAPFFYQLFAFPGLPGYETLHFGDYLSLVILDTGHANEIPGKQTEWLEQTLDGLRGQLHVIPVYHVPAFPSHRAYAGRLSAEVREHWLPLFERMDNLKVAFENHDHTYKRTPPIRNTAVSPDDGIVYVGDGAWGVATRPVHDPETTWYLERAESIRHAIIMTIHPDTLDFEVVSEDGEIIDRFRIE